MSEVSLPIRLISIFPTWAITHCFNRYEEMEQWLEERKLELKKVYQVGEYLCCIAASENTKVEEVL